MDIGTAIEIVHEYGKILEEDPIKNVQGRPLSKLSCHKDKIKEAIQVDLVYVGTAEKRDEKLYRTLQLGYLQLASFIPDKEVVAPFKVDVALASSDVCHKYYKYLVKCEKVSNSILAQTTELVDELDEFCRDNGLLSRHDQDTT
ncbi:MAG: hypothetical protein MRJ65_01900 [Candidatus Brocadiaceae bacterium]|nr:hypothetical protein [Candidatus Brocadiaceae bacterium]